MDTAVEALPRDVENGLAGDACDDATASGLVVEGLVVEEIELAGEPLEGEDGESTLDLSATVSAILFSSSRPLKIETLMNLSGRGRESVENALADVRAFFSDNVHGFALCEVNGGYQLRTSAGAAPVIRKLLHARTRKLSRAAAETLAVVAYKQPVTRAVIEAIRGVDALPTLKTLLEQKLIHVVGQESSIGQPALYGTTDIFLERFGLSDLDSLPSERELLELENEPGESVPSEDSSDAINGEEQEAHEPTEIS